MAAAAATMASGARRKPPSRQGLLFAFARVMTQLGAPPGPILAALRTARPDIELAASVYGHLYEAVVLEDVERCVSGCWVDCAVLCCVVCHVVSVFCHVALCCTVLCCAMTC